MMTQTAPRQVSFTSLLKKFAASTAGIFLYSTLQSLGGVAILLFFIALLYTPAVLPAGLPLIVGFNSAAAGFSFLERSRGNLSSAKMKLLLMGVVIGLCSSTLLIFFCPWVSISEPINHIQSVIASLSFTYLGGWIGMQSRKYNRSSVNDGKEENL